MKTLKSFVCRVSLVLFAVCAIAATAQAQTTAFTYQGRLSEGGQAATGAYDLQFNLYDQAAGANLPLNGQPLTFDNVQVSSRVFTAAH